MHGLLLFFINTSFMEVKSNIRKSLVYSYVHWRSKHNLWHFVTNDILALSSQCIPSTRTYGIRSTPRAQIPAAPRLRSVKQYSQVWNSLANCSVCYVILWTFHENPLSVMLVSFRAQISTLWYNKIIHVGSHGPNDAHIYTLAEMNMELPSVKNSSYNSGLFRH